MSGSPTHHEGRLDAAGMRVGLVVSRFHHALTARLLDGALDCLRRHGLSEADALVAMVPGSFEIPLAAQRLARSGKVDAVVGLGVVIRGETAHFDLVAGEVARGLGQVALAANLPVAFGVVTAETQEQAADRCGGKMGNRGFDAALSVIEMVDLLRRLE